MAGAKMKVLLITAQMAKPDVERYAKESCVETSILVFKVPIAAFLTPQTISSNLKRIETKNFDLILVPGLIRGDTSIISKATGISTVKGPRYAADLPTILDSLGEVNLSSVTPADDLLREKLEKKAFDEISKVEKSKTALLKRPGNILIKNLAVGKDFPMRVLGEIVDAAQLSDSEIQSLALRYVQDGADVIDVGMLVGESRPKDAKRVVAAVKAAVNAPVSIDSLDPEEIKAAVSAGVDLVLSADAGNISSIASFLGNVAVVVIPTNQKEGYFPKKAQERVQLLEKIINDAKRLGVTKVLADLVLDPSEILKSFDAFRQFAEKNPEIPLFVGISNVTELIDADSVGVNALLAKLSSEVGISMLLATERSDKAKGTIKEEVTAAKMMFLAKKRGSVPKDLGIDLLMLKDKRNREEVYDERIEQKSHVLVANRKELRGEFDKEGSFRIFVDREEQFIIAQHFGLADELTPSLIVKGKTAEQVYDLIVESGLVTGLNHAAYLGSELQKAEIGLRTGKEYIQDKKMFK
jgi:dihydropteroate synthase-like protein